MPPFTPVSVDDPLSGGITVELDHEDGSLAVDGGGATGTDWCPSASTPAACCATAASSAGSPRPETEGHRRVEARHRPGAR
ncbi:hypothetical protein ACIHFC_22715 [Streptomyces sp. NPDC052013]|uniref:hypothetical protein n=1 Tax=Streptomyces sp. NPDC052013 TaxID=3365679 RepID=UPI0037D796CC